MKMRLIHLILIGRIAGANAATLTTLHTFSGADGNRPLAALVQGADGNLYGTTHAGGTNTNCPSGCGTVFKITTAGTLTRLHSFDASLAVMYPDAWTLVQGSGTNFFGTTAYGGADFGGSVFKITSLGTFASLYDFDFNVPSEGGLVLGNDGNFYGTTQNGGGGTGSVFRVTPSGVQTDLYSFTGGGDGSKPFANLVQGSDSNFYGTTYGIAMLGGTNYFGTVFKVSSSGTLTTLYRFMGGPDGGFPAAGLVQGSDANFYGVTQRGGTGRIGAVFKITSAGSMTVLHSFTGIDGSLPQASLIQASDGNFYGTTVAGGTNNLGTVFKVTSAGTFTTLYQFSGYTDGANPRAAVVQGFDGLLYGTTQFGGTNSMGTIFKISIP